MAYNLPSLVIGRGVHSTLTSKMTKKKSKTQINRMKKRAESRGEEYEYVNDSPKETEATSPKEEKGGGGINAVKLAAAQRLRKELNEIETNQELKSKERRYAKRKAEAIVAEEAGCNAEELLQWFEEHGRKYDTTVAKGKKKGDGDEKFRKNLYIVFVGQLSYDTTREGLFNHIKNHLGKEHEVTEETVQIRLLTDTKTNKSRGMAFVEVADPELLYACLKLHHTHLEGRRINVERTAGGGKHSETRKTKLSRLRKEQEQHMSDTVDKMLSDYLSAGELQEKELDDGVIALCKRHSSTVVEAALMEYIEKGGRDMDNPSAYLTFLIGKMATEGVDDPEDKKLRKEGRAGNPRKPGDERARKRARHHSSSSAQRELGLIGSRLKNVSTLLQAGVDMSASDASTSRDLSKIFPSMRRGRGRGYM